MAQAIILSKTGIDASDVAITITVEIATEKVDFDMADTIIKIPVPYIGSNKQDKDTPDSYIYKFGTILKTSRQLRKVKNCISEQKTGVGYIRI